MERGRGGGGGGGWEGEMKIRDGKDTQIKQGNKRERGGGVQE